MTGWSALSWRLVREREKQSRRSMHLCSPTRSRETRPAPAAFHMQAPLMRSSIIFPKQSAPAESRRTPTIPDLWSSPRLGPFGKPTSDASGSIRPNVKYPSREPEVARTGLEVELLHKTPRRDSREDRIRWVSPRQQEHEHPRKNTSPVIKQQKGSCPSLNSRWFPRAPPPNG